MSSARRLFNHLLGALQKHQAIRWQISLYVISFSAYGRIQAAYERTHAKFLSMEQDEYGRQLDDQFRLARVGSAPGNKRRATKNEPPFKWRPFPRYPRSIFVLRRFSTICLCLLVIEHSLGLNLFELLRNSQQLTSGRLPPPSDCYLFGRLVFTESFVHLIAGFFAALFLINRLYMTLGPPTRLNLIYALLFHERDTQKIYARFSRPGWSSLARPKRLEAAERLLLETMCFRVHYPAQVVYKLRANRTAGANLELRKCVARMSLLDMVLLLFLGSAFLAFLVQYSLDSHYLPAHPTCEPKLEQLPMEDSGKISASKTSLGLGLGHKISLLYDVMENCVLWIECGLVLTFVSSAVHLINYDLVLHWKGIRRKIDLMESIVKRETRADGGRQQTLELACLERCSSLTSTQRRARDFKLRHELVAEMNDFFVQVRQTSKFIAYILNFALIGSLTFSSLITYQLRKKSLDHVPWQLFVIFGALGLAFCLGSYSCMLVHGACRKSYTRFCSLVANDPMKHRLGYTTLIEHYREHSDCYKLMNMYPFLPSTLLTFVGWFISCFVIVSEVLARGMRQ